MTQTTNLLQINADRLNHNLEQLAQIGKLPNGGVSRIAFSPDDQRARQQVRQWMEAAGMTTRVDAAGNLIGRYPGARSGPALATGSHIDTVPVAGRYDGCLGVLAGIEVVRVLQENQIQLNHPLEVIVFTDEENSVIGCKAMAGNVHADSERYRRLDGTSIEACLALIGGNWAAMPTARRDRSEIAAFVELHVEQGGVLEHLRKPIGVVEGIVGQYRFSVQIIGRPNHAGTTPMHLRKDALLAAAQVIVAVNRLAVETPGDQVATVGYLTVAPNATNTVAAAVDLKIDLRDLSEEHLQSLIDQMQQAFTAIAATTGTEITMQELLHIRPTLSALHIMETIVQVCEDLQLDYTHLPSRAGHDAQEIGRFTDMGMIFVPSRNGISHSEEEYTDPVACAQGANVLLHTLLKLDQTDL